MINLTCFVDFSVVVLMLEYCGSPVVHSLSVYSYNSGSSIGRKNREKLGEHYQLYGKLWVRISVSMY